MTALHRPVWRPLIAGAVARPSGNRPLRHAGRDDQPMVNSFAESSSSFTGWRALHIDVPTRLIILEDAPPRRPRKAGARHRRVSVVVPWGTGGGLIRPALIFRPPAKTSAWCRVRGPGGAPVSEAVFFDLASTVDDRASKAAFPRPPFENAIRFANCSSRMRVLPFFARPRHLFFSLSQGLHGEERGNAARSSTHGRLDRYLTLPLIDLVPVSSAGAAAIVFGNAFMARHPFSHPSAG